MNILATVDTVATNIIAKNCGRKKPLFETFSIQSKTKAKCEIIRTMFLESQFACFAAILSYFASWSVYKAGRVTLALK